MLIINLFSFNGRIKRTEYVITFIFYIIVYVFIRILVEQGSGSGLFAFLYIPLFWLMMAQSAKRCHDLNKSGWWQLIPFYGFVLLFAAGYPGPNEYDTIHSVFYGADDYEKPFVIDEANREDVIPPVV
jgi:uncharacterized membrane protein YhaH (DUF805 family)